MILQPACCKSMEPWAANDKCGNEVKSGAVYRFPGIYHTTEINPGKFQIGDRLMKAVRPVIASNWVLYLGLIYLYFPPPFHQTVVVSVL